MLLFLSLLVRHPETEDGQAGGSSFNHIYRVVPIREPVLVRLQYSTATGETPETTQLLHLESTGRRIVPVIGG